MASETEKKDLPPWPMPLQWFARCIIAAMALYDLWWFIDFLPSFSGPGGSLINWLDFFSIYMAAPLGGATALILAIKGERLKLAAILAFIPPIYWVLSVIAFGIAVMIYGF